MTYYPFTWTTESEIQFLTNLGKKFPSKRLHLLLGYQAGILLRDTWIDIDPILIRRTVDSMIQVERRKQK